MENATGGAVQTGNPQNIGQQSISSPQSSLQTNSSGLLNNSSSLKIVDENGHVLSTATTTTSTQATTHSPNSHRNVMPVVLVSGLLIVAVFIATWLMNQSSSLGKYKY